MDCSIYKPLQESDLVKASIEDITPIPPGGNPYIHDSHRSGISIPKGWEVMYEMSKPGALEEIILVNHFTGQRLKVGFVPKYHQLKDIIQADQSRDVRYVSGSSYLPDVRDDGTIRWERRDDLNGFGIDDLYTLWWGEQGLYYVKANLFLDTERFPKAWMDATEDASFDPNRLYSDDVDSLKRVLVKYDLGTAPSTANNVTAKPFGLNE